MMRKILRTILTFKRFFCLLFDSTFKFGMSTIKFVYVFFIHKYLWLDCQVITVRFWKVHDLEINSSKKIVFIDFKKLIRPMIKLWKSP